MSKYSFIASDYKLPEVYNSKEKIVTVKEAKKLGMKLPKNMSWVKMNQNEKIILYENEDDLGELVITEGTNYQKNVEWYTKKKFIYTVQFQYTEERIKELTNYLKKNFKKGYNLELWSIWLDDKKNIQPKIYNYNKIDLDEIKKMYDYNREDYEGEGCIKIK